MKPELKYYELKYYELKYCCIHGGQAFRPNTERRQKHTVSLVSYACTVILCLTFFKTFKQDCPVHISLRVNEDGTAPVVKSLRFDHNH